jgi:predicted nucleotidyltransferase
VPEQYRPGHQVDIPQDDGLISASGILSRLKTELFAGALTPFPHRITINREVTMRTLAEIKKILHTQKPYLAQKYGVTEIGVFGSYVRGEQTQTSDLDILVELEKPVRIDLLDLIEMENYLGRLLQVKVDIVIKENLKRRIGRQILQETVML